MKKAATISLYMERGVLLCCGAIVHLSLGVCFRATGTSLDISRMRNSVITLGKDVIHALKFFFSIGLRQR